MPILDMRHEMVAELIRNGEIRQARDINGETHYYGTLNVQCVLKTNPIPAESFTGRYSFGSGVGRWREIDAGCIRELYGSSEAVETALASAPEMFKYGKPSDLSSHLDSGNGRGDTGLII